MNQQPPWPPSQPPYGQPPWGQQPPPQYRPPQQTQYGQPPYGESPRSQQQPTQPPPTQYYPQYPNYQPQQQNRPMMPLPYPQFQTPVPGTGQPKKKHGPWFWILIAFGILIVFSMCMSISQAANQSGSVNNTSASATDTLAPTDTPTDTPVPTLSSTQVEKVYKASTTSITVDNLDKEGNNDKGKDVHFTCKILKFVKDNSGNTAGANVITPQTIKHLRYKSFRASTYRILDEIEVNRLLSEKPTTARPSVNQSK